MKYPTVQLGHARLGQVTDLDIDKLFQAVGEAEKLFNTAPPAVQEEFEQDLRICKEAAGWAQQTRNLNDYMDANSCIAVLLGLLRGAMRDELVQPASWASEEPKPPTPAEVRDEIEGLAVWPWVAAAGGAVVLGLAVWAAAS